MKNIFFLVLSAALSLGVHAGVKEEKLYKTSFLFHGLSSNFGLSAGSYLTLKKEKGAPELMVGICGSSLIAAIAYIFPKDEEFNEFLDSKLFHSILASNRFRSIFPYIRPKIGLKFNFLKHFVIYSPQNLDEFTDNASDYPTSVEKKFLKLFTLPIGDVGKIIAKEEEALGIPKRSLVVLSAKSTETLSTIKKNKLTPQFQENFFITDPRVEEKLKGQVSNIYGTLTDEQKSLKKISPVISFDMEETLYGAVRASISEPILTDSYVDRDGYVHLAGSLSQHPYEYLDQLSGEVNGIFNGMFPKFASKIFNKSFGYSLNDRIKSALGKKISTYIVDFSRSEKDLEEKKASMAPGADDVFYRFPFKLGLRIIPNDHETFKEQFKIQMDYGVLKTMESFDHPKSIEHLDFNNYMM